MSSGPFGDRTEAEAASRELENYLFEDGFANSLIELLKFLTSMPPNLRPARITEFLLKEFGILEQNGNADAMQDILHKARTELEQGVLENSRLKVRVQELYEMWQKHDQTVNAEGANTKHICSYDSDGRDCFVSNLQ
ncbi:hypothetical protein RB195_012287 [Necator americanus]|uniref:Uncharacterized protein n=1 Tax=Necator americanus TaxID=51031 RepID=A0ABR1D783_NECAM